MAAEGESPRGAFDSFNFEEQERRSSKSDMSGTSGLPGEAHNPVKEQGLKI